MDLTSVSPALLHTGGIAAGVSSGMSPLEAVEEFEALLIGEMLKTVREAGKALGEEETETGSETYLEMSEQHLARTLARSGMLGFAKLLRDDLGVDSAPKPDAPERP